jgi:hypothetical protein
MGTNAKRNFLEIKLKSAKQIKRPRETKWLVKLERGFNFLFGDSAKTDRLCQASKFVYCRCDSEGAKTECEFRRKILGGLSYLSK